MAVVTQRAPSRHDFLVQESVSGLKWDPTGHLLLSTGRSDVVKVWGRAGSSWLALYSLFHTSLVNVTEWCPLPGTGSEPLLMMAV